MHEVDMTRCLLLSMQEWRQRHAPSLPTVRTVHLQVGDFTCVEPEQLSITWGVATADSWLQGSRLAIEPVPLVGRCLACGGSYSPSAAAGYRSPCCDRPMEEIVSGRELRIRSVDYELRASETTAPYAPKPDPNPDPSPTPSQSAVPSAVPLRT